MPSYGVRIRSCSQKAAILDTKLSLKKGKFTNSEKNACRTVADMVTANFMNKTTYQLGHRGLRSGTLSLPGKASGVECLKGLSWDLGSLIYLQIERSILSRDTCQVKCVCWDDHQIYYSEVDPVALEEFICREVQIANQWYHDNGMIVNEKKHQALNLGNTEYFPLKDSMNIDNKLQKDQ